MNHKTENLIIIGASARAAAQSAVRAGFHVFAADLFADEDLRAIATAVRIRDYPRGLLAAAERFPPGPFIYTGGLENHPEILAAISKTRPLLGAGPVLLSQVRDPVTLFSALAAAEIPCPATRLEPPPADDPLPWLVKPLRSCGGSGVRPWRPEDAEAAALAGREIAPAIGRGKRRLRAERRGFHDNGPFPDRWSGPPKPAVFQQWLAGTPVSAAFLGAGGAARLLGTFRQLIGVPWTGARGFQYAGAILHRSMPGAGEPDVEADRQWRRIGEVIVRRFGLTGLFGVDAIDFAARLFALEVNPRWTASMELIDRAGMRETGESLISLHVQGCRGDAIGVYRRGRAEPAEQPTPACSAKAVLYATRPLVVGERFQELARESNEQERWGAFADLPTCGTRINPSQPFCTVFSEGPNEEATINTLRAHANVAFDSAE